MIYAVTGAGPRTGTSWTMGKLKEAGLPVFWTEGVKIIGAEYETWIDDLPALDNVIAKVWPAFLSRVNVGKMVVLRRDSLSQITSIRQQIDREHVQGLGITQTPIDIIDRAKWVLDQVRIPRLEVKTEDLDDRIDEIIEWMSEPFEQARMM